MEILSSNEYSEIMKYTYPLELDISLNVIVSPIWLLMEKRTIVSYKTAEHLAGLQVEVK